MDVIDGCGEEADCVGVDDGVGEGGYGDSGGDEVVGGSEVEVPDRRSITNRSGVRQFRDFNIGVSLSLKYEFIVRIGQGRPMVD